MHVNPSQPSPSSKQTLDAEMLSDLESFLDGREFAVTPGMKLQFTPGEDKHSPLDIHITAERKTKTSYLLVIKFYAQYEAGRKIALSTDGVELSIRPAQSGTGEPVREAQPSGALQYVQRAGALQFGPFRTGNRYVFNFQPGVFAKLEAPQRYLQESVALEQPQETEPEAPSTADTVVADGSLSDTVFFDR